MKGLIALSVIVVALVTFVVLGFTHTEWLHDVLPGGLRAWFKPAARLALPLALVGWGVYAAKLWAKRAGTRSVEPLPEPHMMMHLGYTIVPLSWDGGNMVEVNAFHEYVHENEEWTEYKEDWQNVFWHAHQELHEWMENNSEDVQGYTQAVNWQRLNDQISEPDFTYGPATPPLRPENL